MNQGYGELIWFMRKELAHRVSWTLAKGPIPDGLFVCHHCDNRRCVRPVHLFLGTCAENFQDMRNKNRGVDPPKLAGERNHKAKLSAEDVLHIRKELAAGVGNGTLAKAYGVNPMTIHRIKFRLNWQHI